MTEQRWKYLMTRLSLPANTQTFRELQAAYAEKHRHYHTGAHIDSCLKLLEECIDLAARPEEVELAVWFHDAIYNPMSKDNEAKSADWAMRFLADNNCAKTVCERVRNMIMATVHDAAATDPDTQLLVDIDLSILGSDADAYHAFETNVRREYKWVPGPLFRKGRRSILQSFIDRESIYSTVELRKRFEDRARINIAAELESLQ